MSALISIVIPMFNEQENVPVLVKRLTDVLSPLGDYEVIFVDDGSSDRSALLIAMHCQENPAIKLLQFSRNFGHQAAISAGLAFAKGDAVIVMDGDLQDPPEVLPQFIAKWKEGYDVVYAIRTKRKENFVKRFCYFAFYRILGALSSIHIPLDSGDFGLVDRKVVAAMNSLPEKVRFVRGIRSWTGFRQVGLAYERAARYSGKPKFTFTKLVKLAYDGLISFTHVPLRLSSYIGAVLTLVSLVSVIAILCVKLFVKTDAVEGWASTLCVLLLISGVQFLLMGVQSEYIARVYDEVKQRPQFIVSKTINIDQPRSQSLAA